MQTKTLFMMEDSLLGQCGLYTMWSLLYITNLIILSTDDTVGPSRDFNIITNGLSVLYCGAASANIIYGNKLPSTMMMTIGPIHQYLFWMLFVYYGKDDVLGSHPIGVYNWVTVIIVGLFTADMVTKSWFLSWNPKNYLEYMKEKCSTDRELESIEVEQPSVQNVVAKFTFKEGKLDEFKSMMQHPETGLVLTRSCDGYINIDVMVDEDAPNVLVLVQKWKTKQNHLDYIQKRKDMGMFDQLVEMLEVEPEIRYVKAV